MSWIKRSLNAGGGPINLTGSNLLKLFPDSRKTASQESVSEDSALGISAYYRGLSLITGLVASAPLTVTSRETKTIGDSLLLREPSQYMSRFEFYELMVTHLINRGNFVAIKRRRKGEVVELLPVDPSNVQVYVAYRKNGTVVDRFYRVSYTVNSTTGALTKPHGGKAVEGTTSHVDIPSKDIFHVMDMSTDGLWGRSRIEVLRESFGTAQATERFAGQMYGNGALLSGVLMTDKRLTEEQAESLRSRWRQKLSGLDNAFEIAILDQGAKFESMSMSAQDSQFIESRRFGVSEAARILGVPLHLLAEGDLSDGIELTSQEFVRFTLSPIGHRIADRLGVDVLPSSQKCSFDFSELVAPDVRTRAQSITLHRNANVTTINEERGMLGLEPVADERANDVFFVPKSPKGGAKLGDNQDQPGQQQPTQDDPDTGDEPESDAPLTESD